jgi:hypothetical protein
VASSANRLVAYSRERREYLNFSCTGGTESRVWAWSGTVRQAQNMVASYPAAEDYLLFWDGDEMIGAPVSVT